MAAHWLGKVPLYDDFDSAITDQFIDGKTIMGPWGIMTPENWKKYSGTGGKLGSGMGQRYEKKGNTWPKVEG